MILLAIWTAEAWERGDEASSGANARQEMPKVQGHRQVKNDLVSGRESKGHRASADCLVLAGGMIA